jgi:hypothetical protein
MPENSVFIELTLGTACVGDGRALIPLRSVLAKVIVGQGLEPRKNKLRLICVPTLRAPLMPPMLSRRGFTYAHWGIGVNRAHHPELRGVQKLRNSASVRSRPPVITNMFKSMNFPKLGSRPGGIITSSPRTE